MKNENQNQNPACCQLIEAETVLAEYIQKYGLTEAARRYFLKRRATTCVNGISDCEE